MHARQLHFRQCKGLMCEKSIDSKENCIGSNQSDILQGSMVSEKSSFFLVSYLLYRVLLE
jgi:hypothetical protein